MGFIESAEHNGVRCMWHETFVCVQLYSPMCVCIIPPPAAVSTVIGADCKNKNPCHKYPIQFFPIGVRAAFLRRQHYGCEHRILHTSVFPYSNAEHTRNWCTTHKCQFHFSSSIYDEKITSSAQHTFALTPLTISLRINSHTDSAALECFSLAVSIMPPHSIHTSKRSVSASEWVTVTHYLRTECGVRHSCPIENRWKIKKAPNTTISFKKNCQGRALADRSYFADGFLSLMSYAGQREHRIFMQTMLGIRIDPQTTRAKWMSST